MKRSAEAVEVVHEAVRSLPGGRYVLAVSGGRDSMVLLDAWHATRDDAVGVATFDHGTGPTATRAARFVVRAAERAGIPVFATHARPATDEASLRAARWEFLGSVVREVAVVGDTGAHVVTAHTLDDQVETVFLRLLRGSGVRGLAAMYAPSRVRRPLLAVRREMIAAYAAARRVRWVEDPSNAALDYFRNRVRHEILPAFEARRPGFSAWLLGLSARAAELRRRVAELSDAIATPQDHGAALVVPAEVLGGIAPEGLRLLWPELASRVGIALERRGLERLAREAASLAPGGSIPMAGGGSVSRTVSTYVIRNSGRRSPLY